MTQPNNSVYLILGATGGIGSALCRRLARDGAHLMLGARTEETLRTLAAETGGSAHTLDATDFEQVQRLVTHTEQTYGRLDGVANCVGSIRVNCVAPGLVQTPMTARITGSEAGRRQSEAMHALGRLGEPDDVAGAIHWLLDGTRSGWVTGQVIGIDGGLGTVRPR